VDHADRGGLISITIYGAGAIGGLIGAYLARAGEDARFVDPMAEHVEAMSHAISRKLQGSGGRRDEYPIFTGASIQA